MAGLVSEWVIAPRIVLWAFRLALPELVPLELKKAFGLIFPGWHKHWFHLEWEKNGGSVLNLWSVVTWLFHCPIIIKVGLAFWPYKCKDVLSAGLGVGGTSIQLRKVALGVTWMSYHLSNPSLLWSSVQCVPYVTFLHPGSCLKVFAT